ncbi:hypothetical protein [Bdellovibrio sp. HCB274]|uniref:hypothetical protein n=1 Tax=Bdellovibrio sp. HCB274 TaxID=3394361 RepID=UPI0039B378AC
MKNLRVKTVELLCALVTIAATSAAYAQTAKVDVSQALENWRRQESISVSAVQKGIIREQPKYISANGNSTALGGPGLDGGGGVGVINSLGQLRFLDQAIGNNNTLVRFDKESYLRIMSQKGNFISNKGTYVSNAEFFACAFDRLQIQDNVLLQFLKPENLRLTVAFTDLPLSRGSVRPSKVVFPSPFGSGFAWEVTQLPASNLFSPSVPADYQKPIASYAVQPTVQSGTSLQVLLVSSQMYNRLSWKDQCALQVHELLRYISNVGAHKVSLLLKRPLSTAEIENLTRKIINKQPVYLAEIPATNFYKYLAVNGSDKFAAGVQEHLSSVLYSPEDDHMLLPEEAESIYDSQRMSILVQQAHEETVLQLGRDYHRLRSILIERDKKLQGSQFSIRDLVF